MKTEDRLKVLRAWPEMSAPDKDAYFAKFLGFGAAAPEIPDAYRKCMERCTNKHMAMLERCNKLEGAAAFECAQRVEEEMMHCYDGCSVMI